MQHFGWYVEWFTVSCTHIWVHVHVKLAAIRTHNSGRNLSPNILWGQCWITGHVTSQWWRLQTFLSGEASDGEGDAEVMMSAQALPHTHTHNLSSAHTHTWIKIQLWTRLPLCSSIISYTKRLMRQLASCQMAFQICSAPFVYFSDFGGVWKSFADSAAHSDVMAGFCSCRVAGKMCTLVVSKQLKFYYKWFHICTQRGEKTRLGFERWRPLWGQIPLNAASHSRKSLSNRRPKEEKHFGTILPLLLRYFGHCCLAIKHQSVKAYPGSSEQLGPWWAFWFLVSFAIDTFSDFF